MCLLISYSGDIVVYRGIFSDLNTEENYFLFSPLEGGSKF